MKRIKIRHILIITIFKRDICITFQFSCADVKVGEVGFEKFNNKNQNNRNNAFNIGGFGSDFLQGSNCHFASFFFFTAVVVHFASHVRQKLDHRRPFAYFGKPFWFKLVNCSGT